MYQFKRLTHKRKTLQRSDSKNVGLVQTSDSTNVGLVQTSLVQTSDWDKRRDRILKTLDQYKRWTDTFIRKNVGFWFSLKNNKHGYKNKN